MENTQTEVLYLNTVKSAIAERWDGNDPMPCPVCGKLTKRYKYNPNHTNVSALIRLANMGNGYHHYKSFTKQSGDCFARLKFFGFIEPLSWKSKDKGSAGYWRITRKGLDYIMGRISVEAPVYVFANKVTKVGDKLYDVRRSLGKYFDWREMMDTYPVMVDDIYSQQVLNFEL